MKAASVREIKQELKTRSSEELMEMCLSLSKFKKENKELLTYLLYESTDEDSYISGVKEEVEEQFSELNISSVYLKTKKIRKILRNTKKYIRYSKKKETEVELLIYFCSEMLNLSPSIRRSTVLQNIFQRQFDSIQKTISKLHEDLQYDYNTLLEELDVNF